MQHIPQCDECTGADDSGPVIRGQDGLYFATWCELCGTIGSIKKAEELNKAEAERCRGFMFDRVEFSTHEKACQEVWADENRRRYWLNDGKTALECLMGVEKPTDRDYRVAATIVQFLGTNGGRCLLHRIEQRVAEMSRQASNTRIDGATRPQQVIDGAEAHP